MPMGLAQCCCDRCQLLGCLEGQRQVAVLLENVSATVIGGLKECLNSADFNGLYMLDYVPGSSSVVTSGADVVFRSCLFSLQTEVPACEPPIGSWTPPFEPAIICAVIKWYKNGYLGAPSDITLGDVYLSNNNGSGFCDESGIFLGWGFDGFRSDIPDCPTEGDPGVLVNPPPGIDPTFGTAKIWAI